MKQWIYRLVALAALIAAGIYGYHYFFPSPERVIRKRLLEAQELCSFGPNEGALAKMANAQNLAAFFTTDAQVVVDVQGFSAVALEGRDRIFQTALAARNQMPNLDVSLLDINVTLGPDKQTAKADLTARASQGNQRDFMVQELELNLVKFGRKWLIRKVTTVRTLN